MELTAVLLLILGSCYTTLSYPISTTYRSTSCPIWTAYNYDSSKEYCECGNYLGGIVKCVNFPHQVSVLYCYCMTYNDLIEDFTVGQCYYNCYFTRNRYTCIDKNLVCYTNESFSHNVETCSRFNRDGHLCGDCMEGYGPPVYSYSLKCVQCSEDEFKGNLLKYIIVGYLPLTVFYFVVVLLKFSATSQQMVVYTFACQIMTLPCLMRVIMTTHNNAAAINWIHIMTSLSSIWNLDILRSIYHPFCLHPSLNTMHVMALDYMLAMYPMLLIASTYLAVKLHDQYSFIVTLWKPARKIFTCIRKEWDIRGSVIRAFSTFLYLSYMKILDTSFELLNPVYPIDLHKNYINQSYLYCEGEVEYFGPEHLPFGILAVIMMVVFNILPIFLLLFYPYTWFRKVILCSRFSPTLHTFIESFNGYYKTSPKYYQSFAAIFFMSHFIILLFTRYRNISFAFYSTLYLMILSLAVILLQPFKSKCWNKINFALLFNTSVFFLIVSYYVYSRTYQPSFKGNQHVFHVISFVFFTTSTVCILLVLAFNVIPKPCLLKLLQKCHRCFKKDYQSLETSNF